MKMIITALLLILCLPSHAADCPAWSQEEAQKNMITLTHEITHHNDLYFNKNTPIISDEEYDALVARLKHWQTCFPAIKTTTTDVQKNQGKHTVNHHASMGSLKKADSETEIAEFFQKTLNGEALLQPKIDGVAAELVYQQGRLIKASTRGDGEVGVDILTIVRQMTFIPKTLAPETIDHPLLILHGELFTRLDKVDASLLKQYTSARHLVAGQLNRLESDSQALSAIDFFPWHWVNSPYASDLESIRTLALTGFQLPLKYTRTVKSFEEVKRYRQDYQARNTMPFLMDGIVIKANDQILRKSLGWQSSAPVWAMAWKFPPARGISEVTDIEFTIGRTGNITPVVHFAPVAIQGETVSKVSLGSVDNLQKKDIAIGDHVSVLLKGRATPVFGNVLFRPEQRVLPSVPDSRRYSPFSCLRMSVDCEQQFIARLAWLTGKQGLDLPINKDIIRELVLSGEIKTLVDILRLDQESLTGAGVSIQGSQQYLRSLREPKSLAQQLRAISLPGVGKYKALILAGCIDGLGGLLSVTTEQLEQCSGVSSRLILEIKNYLERPEPGGLIEFLERRIPTQSEAVVKPSENLVPTLCVGTHTELAACGEAYPDPSLWEFQAGYSFVASTVCIPTQSMGTRCPEGFATTSEHGHEVISSTPC